MKKCISSILVSIFLVGESLSASAILTTLESSNPVSLSAIFPNRKESFNLKDVRDFLIQLKIEVRELYGIDLDLQSAVNEAVRTLSASSDVSEEKIAMAKEFYKQVMEFENTPSSLENNTFSKIALCWNPCRKEASPKIELELPDNMALGFMSILGGSLLCILPFGITQGIGGSLIAGGIILIAQDGAQGGRPYYINSQTGERIDFPR